MFFINAVNRNVVHLGTLGLQYAISGRKGTKNIFNNRHFEQKSRDREPKEGQLAILSHHQQPIFRTQRQGETEEITGSRYGSLIRTGMWTLGKHILQIQVEVFHAVAATAENGEDGPYNLAELIAYQLTAKPQVGVDYGGQNTVKSVQNEKYSAKSSDFLRFLLYLCHVIDDFACLDLQH